jgi:hypothetical protein
MKDFQKLFGIFNNTSQHSRMKRDSYHIKTSLEHRLWNGSSAIKSKDEKDLE